MEATGTEIKFFEAFDFRDDGPEEEDDEVQIDDGNEEDNNNSEMESGDDEDDYD